MLASLDRLWRRLAEWPRSADEWASGVTTGLWIVAALLAAIAGIGFVFPPVLFASVAIVPALPLYALAKSPAETRASKAYLGSWKALLGWFLLVTLTCGLQAFAFRAPFEHSQLATYALFPAAALAFCFLLIRLALGPLPPPFDQGRGYYVALGMSLIYGIAFISGIDAIGAAKPVGTFHGTIVDKGNGGPKNRYIIVHEDGAGGSGSTQKLPISDSHKRQIGDRFCADLHRGNLGLVNYEEVPCPKDGNAS